MAPTQRVTGRTKVPEIRKGDTVLVLTGKDAGRRGEVQRVIRRDPSPSGQRTVYRRTSVKGGVYVVVEGLNVAKRHTKPRPMQSQSDRAPRVQQGGILDIPQPLPVNRVMVVCRSCDQPTRIGHRVLDNGRRVRACKRCGETLEARA